MYSTMTFCAATSELLVFGGRTSPGRPVGSLCAVPITPKGPDMAAVCYSAGSGCSLEDPPARWRHAACLLEWNSRILLIVSGGRDENGVKDDVWAFDVASRQWMCLLPRDSNQAPARCSHTLCTVGSKLLLCGGLDKNERPMSDSWWLRLVKDESGVCIDWKPFNPSLPAGRYAHQAYVRECDQKLFIVGGVGSSPGNLPVLSINEGGSSWEVGCKMAEDFMAHNLACVGLDDKAWLIGGGGNCFSFGTHYNEVWMKLSFA